MMLCRRSESTLFLERSNISHSSLPKEKKESLEREMDERVLGMVSDRLTDLLATWSSSRGERMADSELVGCFILGFLALRCHYEGANESTDVAPAQDTRRTRKPRHCWATGSAGCGANHDLYWRSPCCKQRPPLRVVDVPGLLELLAQGESERQKMLCKLLKWCNAVTLDDLTIAGVFRSVRMYGVPDFVNDVMSLWLESDGNVPFILMNSIPTPMEVLRQQACGKRVISLLAKARELSTKHVSALAYMSGGVTHARDALDFLLHDVQHMHMFLQKDIYHEQVGFFHSMTSLGEGKPFKYFTRDLLKKEAADELWLQLQYCFSDMNCWVTHLIKYLKAKWLLHYDCEDLSFDMRWTALLVDIGMTLTGGGDMAAQAFAAASRICSDELSNADGKAIRDFFTDVGSRCLRNAHRSLCE